MHKKIDSKYCLTITGRCLLFLLANCFPQLVCAQRIADYTVNKQVIINADGYIVYAGVLPEKSNKKAKDKLFYYWYNANDIKRTRGGYDGKLLHGRYTEFYADKNLKAKGKFRKGKKIGTWKVWYDNGQYKETRKWKKKGRIAKFREFDSQGNLIRWGTFKDEKYHGVVHTMVSGKPVKRKFKNGEEIIPVKKAKSDTLMVKDKNKKRFYLFKKKERKDSINTHNTSEKRIEKEQKPAGQEKENKEKVKPGKKNDDKVKKAVEPVLPPDNSIKRREMKKPAAEKSNQR